MLVVRAGAGALARIREHGLSPADVAAIPAAAGGPKGLALLALDRFLFGEWLPRAPRERLLIGASIGAWRMAAAALPDPVAGLRRLGDLYSAQRYPRRPTPEHVTQVCRAILGDMLAGEGESVLTHPHHRLVVLAVRGRGRLERAASPRAQALGFALASAANAAGRARLAGFLERVVFHDPRDDVSWLRSRFDPFATHFTGLSPANLPAALLASGTIPLVLAAVAEIHGAPAGLFWDGGLVDYHLHLPYRRLPGLVLYPHFGEHIVPGWLDKAMRWRRAKGAWLDNVVLVAPSPAFIATLPNAKLPDRKDFKRYGLEHDARIRDWRRAMAEGERLADAFAQFLERPERLEVRPF
jgi:hypothetical protein